MWFFGTFGGCGVGLVCEARWVCCRVVVRLGAFVEWVGVSGWRFISDTGEFGCRGAGVCVNICFCLLVLWSVF